MPARPGGAVAGRLGQNARVDRTTHGMTRNITISDASIRLGQLLKLAGLVEDGGHARALLGSGVVAVDGDVETRRGRQIRPGDVVTAPAADEVVTLTVSLR